MNEGVLINEGVDLSHKDISIDTSQLETDFINIDVANYENSNTLSLQLFNNNFPFKNSINAENYRNQILRYTKKISVKYFDVSDNSNREMIYDLDNRDDRLVLFQNFKACLVGNDDATLSPMSKFFSNRGDFTPQLNNFKLEQYWSKDSNGNFVNQSVPLVINLDRAKRTVIDSLPSVKIQGLYQIKLTFRSALPTRHNLLISRDYIGGYKYLRKSIKDDAEIRYFPNSMKNV